MRTLERYDINGNLIETINIPDAPRLLKKLNFKQFMGHLVGYGGFTPAKYSTAKAAANFDMYLDLLKDPSGLERDENTVTKVLQVMVNAGASMMTAAQRQAVLDNWPTE